MNAQQISDHVIQTGYSISYAAVKRIISTWKKSHSSHEVYILPDEEGVKFILRKAFGERISFESLEEAQQWHIASLEQINNLHIYQRDKTPIEALKDEQNSMLPLPSLEYSNILTKPAKISK